MLGFGNRKREKNPAELPFWKRKKLTEMSAEEWESLCDGCGKCCLNKLEDEETGEIHHTNVACRLLDLDSCRCVSYEQRTRFVPDCRRLTPLNVGKIPWLPLSCAYRRLAEGKDLEWWHPLVSGDPTTVVKAGISIRGRTVSERDTDDLEGHIVVWPK
ncbi:MAG: YcgN family cysteine cluster protein [Proteobacteria bacterium]|nr:YcgN family cysteine cluster protein [Pseudomonadota bacterium]